MPAEQELRVGQHKGTLYEKHNEKPVCIHNADMNSL